MKVYPSHKTTLNALKRIEGQVRGLQRMVEDKRYCVDILTPFCYHYSITKSGSTFGG